MSDSQSGGFDHVAQALGLDDDQIDEKPSSYWAHLSSDDLGTAMIDRFTRFHEWLQANGLIRGWKLKQSYYHGEYRANPTIPHLSVLEQWGSQGEYQFLAINHLRSLLKTILASVIQNPPSFTPRAVNSDASAMESAALYQGVLDYYTRDLRLTSKIAKAVEIGVVVDQGYLMVEWDYFAADGDAPSNSGIWKGAPSVKILNPWDVVYDVTKNAWTDLDWVIVRDWVSKEKAKAQFPEFADDIEGCRLKSEVLQNDTEIEGTTRYEMNTFPDMSDDIQVFKLFHRQCAWMPEGRFCMALENGKMIFESPVGLIYPKLPVERFCCDEQTDILLGHSPINEMLAPQEAFNSLVSAIQSNAANYANQYVAVQQGTELNPRTLMDGQKIIEYPAGTHPPVGLNLTSIPESLFAHTKDLQGWMQTIPSVSNASRGQAPGANSTGSAMLFLSSQTSANQGNMSENYSEFCANVMTSLLHVLRVFGRTEKTIQIMGQNVASKTVVLATALKDFDEVVVDTTNSILNTPQGRMGFAQQLLQFGNATPELAMQVATSGNLGPATDPVREMLYELELENQWLRDGETILVNALDDHEAHVKAHTRLFATPWLRKPDLAAKLGITNAPQIMQVIQDHIMQHMQFLGQNQAGSMATTAGATPGQPETAPSAALGHMPAPSPDAPINAPAQAGAVAAGTHLPAAPNQPQPPR